MQVVTEAIDPETKALSLSAPNVRRTGGKLEPPATDMLALRIILDHSLLEIFTGSGQVVTTRVARGAPPQLEDVGIDFLCFGGQAELASMHAWELASIWSTPQVRPAALCPAAV